MLGKLTENVEGTFDPDEQQTTKLDNSVSQGRQSALIVSKRLLTTVSLC